jgi:hypothetical protein
VINAEVDLLQRNPHWPGLPGGCLPGGCLPGGCLFFHQQPLRTTYGILTPFSKLLIVFCGVQKKPVPKWWFSFPFPQKKILSPALGVPPLSHLTSHTPTWSAPFVPPNLPYTH